MAQQRTKAWITTVLNDDSVTKAIVLAKSIRRTKSTMQIAVIASENVTSEKRAALGQHFDAVFCQDFSQSFTGVDQERKEIYAKLYGFSLTFFEQCVFLESNCLMLENCDGLFDGKKSFKFLKSQNGSLDLSAFAFSPNKKLYAHLLQNVSQNGTNLEEKVITNWLRSQGGTVKFGSIPEGTFAKFPMTEGVLMTDKTHAAVVQFVGLGNNCVEEMKSMKTRELGLPETMITATWLEISGQTGEAPVLQSLEDNRQNYEREPIAIIGMSCRYPGANSLEEFWNMLYQGEEGIREPPAFRWTKEHSLRVTQQQRQTNVGFLSTTVDEFDAKFFGVSPKEAAYMDPQTRLLHEVMWEGLEDSGIDPLSLYGSHTGIFTGSWMNDYKDIVQGSTEQDFFRTYMGNSIGAAAARLSFLLGLTGPSIATESGCSSAIVALDLAVKSLRIGESNLAVAGGVNLLLHPFTSNIIEYVISQNGRCKTFDAKADGFGRAEGCGVLVLKRLSDAMRDRDNIWGVVRGSAVSQEGLSRSLGTPTVHCEALAMQLALQDANISPERVSFVETHGTGTAVGDPMEVAAIAKAYHSPGRVTPLVIGSVKTNVGHTESCSGITGIMKTILAMQHELIPKHRNLESINPEIFLDSIPAMIPMEAVPWPKVTGKPRIAGVSSFGITGTDGHVIIEEAPDYGLPKFTLGMERPTHIVKISGKSPEALDELLVKYENLFSEKIKTGQDSLADSAFSGNVGRANFNHRAFLIAQDNEEAANALKEKKCLSGEVKDSDQQQICFLFTGQGSQYPGMAKLLYSTSPVFRVNFDACDRTLRNLYNLSIREVLWDSDPASKELSRTLYSQTSIFCVEYCLFKLWQTWGIQPDFVLGHSLGEFCAAVAAGLLDFKDALKLVAERSRLIDSLPRGSMLVIKASQPEVVKMLKEANVDLDFAAINSVDQTVMAGDTEEVQRFLSYLKDQGQKAMILGASHAFHSRHMDPVLEQYRKIAETVKYKQGNGVTQYVSGMDGRIIGDFSEITADYWVRHTREKVSFVEACAALRDTGCTDFLEVGPQPVLSSFVMMNNEDLVLNCFPSLRRGTDDWQTILTSLGKLYLLGHQVNWKEFDEPYLRKKVSLPFHPMNRKSFWVEVSGSQVAMIHPLVGYPMNNASAMNIFQNDLTVKSVPYVKDHCIGERIVFPGAGFTEMCLSAGYCVANGLSETLEPPNRAIRLENVRIEAPLELKEEKSCRFQVIVDLPESSADGSPEPDNQGGFRVKIYHQNTNLEESGKWVLHASSSFIPVASTKDSLKFWNPHRISEIIATGELVDPEPFYSRVGDAGLKFGETFRMIQKFWAVTNPDPKAQVDDIVAEMRLPSDANKYLLHPLIIDAAFQTGILTKYRHEETAKLKVPVSLGRLTMFGGDQMTTDLLYLHAWFEDGKYYVFVSTADHKPIALVEDVELIDTNVKTIESVLEQQSSSIPEAWEEAWKILPSPFKSSVEEAPIKPIFADSQFQEKMRQTLARTAEDIDLTDKTNRLLYLYILNALYELGWEPKLGEVIHPTTFGTTLRIQPELQQLVRFYLTNLEEEAVLSQLDPKVDSWKVTSLPPSHDQVKTEMTDLCNFLKTTKVSVVTLIYENLAKDLSKILTGEESALTHLFPAAEDQQHLSALSYYNNHPGFTSMFASFEETCRSIFQKCKDLNSQEPGKVFRLLEVGSGTGSMSGGLLQWLKEYWGDRFEYYFTDISQSFFIKAEKRFEEYGQNIKYALFNIEQSPLSQGIPLNYFDMVSATNVLHATRDLEETLVHLRQTLRPGGVLNIGETVDAARDITFVFGLLEGYWCFKDLHRRPHHCCVNEQVWKQLVTQCGFEFDAIIKAQVDPFAYIYATAAPDVNVNALGDNLAFVKTPHDTEAKKEWVVFADANNLEVCSNLANVLDASGFKVTTVLKAGSILGSQAGSKLKDGIATRAIMADNENPADIEALVGSGQLQGIIYAWGLDLTEKDQKKVALPLLHIVKTILGHRKPPQMYILTQGVQPVLEDSLSSNPTAATLFGMAKALKNESTGLFVRYVDLEQALSPAEQVDQVLFELAMSRGAKEQQRVQVAYRGNVRYEPRLVKAALPKPGDELKLPPSTDRFHMVLPKTKLIQDLTFTTDEVQEMAESEVEVKIKAYALNFRDIFAVIKPSEEFEKINTVGLDFAGVITKTGVSDNGTWKVGDRVFGTNFKQTQLASHLTVERSHLLRIPDTMTFCEAATIPAVVSTAYYCLVNVANLKKGETVLIHTGSGGVGLAAIQLAKNLGAKIITTAGNPRKRAYLRALGIEHVFHSRNTSYEQDILRATNGKGVDVVLNSITGPGFKEATLRATAKNARFIEMSKLTIWSPEEVRALRPDVDYSIVDLTSLERDKFGNLLDDMRRDLTKGLIKSIPYVKFGALHIRQALEYFQKARHIGKVVCAMPDVSIEGGQYKVHIPQFNGESTYLITGGLGGIGFEVCKWMVGLGATDVVLTGRRPPVAEVALQIAQMNKSGLNVMVKLGDVGDLDQCRRIIEDIGKDQEKPLRGVMHAAGVLRDNFYAGQTWETFNATFHPKVNGSWNLHNLTLGLPLEHFVVYSSVSALVGFAGQPNHVSANCFEDAFIHHRYSLGLPGTTINWGQWAQVGCAKELSLSGVAPVSVKRMLNGMELVFKAQKRQVCFSDFDSFNNVCILCPIMRSYLDDKLWKQATTSTQNKGVVNVDQFWKEMDSKETKVEKMEVMAVHIKAVLRAALRLEPDEQIGDDVNIQELGVDSLMMLELKNSIQALLGSRVNVTTNLIKNCNTVRLIANAVVDKLVDQEGEEDVVLEPLGPSELYEVMTKDSVLEDSFQGTGPDTLPPSKPSQIKSVLVTGVTGLLGPYLVSQLTRDYPSVSKITCLIRGADDITIKEKLKATLTSFDLTNSIDLTKIECVPGDVALPNLGLPKPKYDALCKSIDAIIHCAAKTDHVEPYRPSSNRKLNDSRSVNVGGLLNILKLATTTKLKHIYYPSTFLCGVFTENEEGTLPDDWPTPESLQTVVDNNLPGIKISKYICEMLLHQASQRGIPCKVFRFPWIAGEDKTGRINYLNNLYILRYLSFLRVSAMPSLAIPANFLPIDMCAQFSLNLFFRDDTPCEIFNIGHPSPQVEQEFVQLAKEEFGKSLDILDWNEYVQLLEDFQTEDEALKKLYSDQKMISKYIGDAVVLVKKYQVSPDTYFTNKKMSEYLPNYEEKIAPSMEMMKRDLTFLKETGFLEKFI